MATTYPLPSLVAQITAEGISAPSYADIYKSLQASFQLIYATDAYIDPDSQDGQLLAVFAKALSAANDTAIGVYNQFSPASATGRGLSNQVKINGLSRGSASNSTTTGRVTGTVGTEIIRGIASDAQGNRWLLPFSVVIPISGQIDVTLTAEKEGALQADVGTVTQIMNPQLGWQAITNIDAAEPGADVEKDAALRIRQAYSTALPSQTILAGIRGTIANLSGVTDVQIFENDTDATDANGLPPHSMAAVVAGGDLASIASVIQRKKTPGTSTYGDDVVQVTDPKTGILYNIRLSRPDDQRLQAVVTIKAKTGYTTTIGTKIKQALSDYVNALTIGVKVDWGRLFLPAQLYGTDPDANRYELDDIQIAIYPATPVADDVVIAWNQRARLVVADVGLVVT